MKIYTKIVFNIDTFETVEEDSFEYEGELALCDGSDSDGGYSSIGGPAGVGSKEGRDYNAALFGGGTVSSPSSFDASADHKAAAASMGIGASNSDNNNVSGGGFDASVDHKAATKSTNFSAIDAELDSALGGVFDTERSVRSDLGLNSGKSAWDQAIAKASAYMDAVEPVTSIAKKAGMIPTKPTAIAAMLGNVVDLGAGTIGFGQGLMEGLFDDDDTTIGNIKSSTPSSTSPSSYSPGPREGGNEHNELNIDTNTVKTPATTKPTNTGKTDTTDTGTIVDDTDVDAEEEYKKFIEESRRRIDAFAMRNFIDGPYALRTPGIGGPSFLLF